MNATRIDALLVLGGEDRQAWPRCRAALHYYRHCCERGVLPPRFIVSGGKWVWHKGRWSTESVLMVRFLLAHGIPADAILLEPQATDTIGNVVWGGALAERHGLTRMALVTDDFHHWRSRRIFMQVFGAVPGTMVRTGVKGSWLARIRERVAYWLLRFELRSQGVQKGNLDAHKNFLRRRHQGRARQASIFDLQTSRKHGKLNHRDARSGHSLNDIRAPGMGR